MYKQCMKEEEAEEIVKNLRIKFLKSMEEIGHPILSGHGDLQNIVDEKRIKEDIENQIMVEIKRVYNVGEC